jgi:YidC/Oxa1 family membrane protein insertase
MILANVIEDAFRPLITLFEGIMVFIHDNLVGGSWGLAIIGLTIVIRAALVPLTFRQLKSMQEMQRLAPQIQALKEKYKEDKQRQQQELMKFYQENKINPLASCLPLLLQIPVFISLFYMLRTDLKFDICGPQMKVFYTKELGRPIVKNSQVPEHAVTGVHGQHVKGISELGCSQIPGAEHSAKFLFIPDITLKATGAALVVLIVLYVSSQLASTLMATATADPNQRRLMLALPVIFVIILYRYPAGLLVYWITTNMWTIGQQYVIRRHMGPMAPPATKPKESGRKPVLRPALAGGGGGGGGSGGGSSGGSAPATSDGKAEKGAKAAPKTAPPPPPRKKKKRSGRRR